MFYVFFKFPYSVRFSVIWTVVSEINVIDFLVFLDIR